MTFRISRLCSAALEGCTASNCAACLSAVASDPVGSEVSVGTSSPRYFRTIRRFCREICQLACLESLRSASATILMVLRTLDGFTLMESMPQPTSICATSG